MSETFLMLEIVLAIVELILWRHKEASWMEVVLSLMLCMNTVAFMRMR